MSDNSQNKLSVIMIVKNEEHQIERTLKSVAWADEIVVVDAFSDDNTVSICKNIRIKFFNTNGLILVFSDSGHYVMLPIHGF